MGKDVLSILEGAGIVSEACEPRSKCTCLNEASHITAVLIWSTIVVIVGVCVFASEFVCLLSVWGLLWDDVVSDVGFKKYVSACVGKAELFLCLHILTDISIAVY